MFRFDPAVVDKKIYPLPQSWHASWKTGPNNALLCLIKLLQSNARYINEWIRNSASPLSQIPTTPSGVDVPQWLTYLMHPKSMRAFLDILKDAQGSPHYLGVDQFLFEFQ